MEATYVIKKPLLTEKSTIASSDFGRYTFEVDVKADKNDIKAAVELLYKVKVVKVNTQIRKARDRMYRYGMIEGKLTKLAHVRLAEGQAIELV
jgi:large subunit ribosomal protein L23